MSLKEEIIAGMKERGFHRVPIRMKGHLYLFNRGNARQSNFFVLAKIKERAANFLFLEMSPVGYGPATYLAFPKYSLSDILDEVELTALTKPSSLYLVHLHGHTRSFAGKRLVDDGLSPYELVVLDLAFHHIDFDLSGFHNNMEIVRIEAMRKFLRAFNIDKGYAAEFTYNIGSVIDGFHVLHWFPNAELAKTFCSDVVKLTPFNKLYPPLPPRTRGEDMLLWLLDHKDVAVGIPHPFYGTRIFGKFHATGIFHYMPRARALIEALVERADAISIFNADAAKSKVTFSNLWMEAFVKHLLERAKKKIIPKKGSTLEGNLNAEDVNLMSPSREGELEIFAADEWRAWGKVVFFEPDSHINPWPSSAHTSLLGQGWNGVVYERRRPTIQEIIRSIKERQPITTLSPYKAKSLPINLRIFFNLTQLNMISTAFVVWKLKPSLEHSELKL